MIVERLKSNTLVAALVIGWWPAASLVQKKGRRDADASDRLGAEQLPRATTRWTPALITATFTLIFRADGASSWRPIRGDTMRCAALAAAVS